MTEWLKDEDGRSYYEAKGRRVYFPDPPDLKYLVSPDKEEVMLENLAEEDLPKELDQ